MARHRRFHRIAYFHRCTPSVYPKAEIALA